MVFLANENFPFPSISLLRVSGIQIISILETAPGISDQEVMNMAKKNNYIILTFDSDYGEMIFRYVDNDPPSIVYFRYKGLNPEFAGHRLKNLLTNDNMSFKNNFTVIEENYIRQRQYLTQTNRNTK